MQDRLPAEEFMSKQPSYTAKRSKDFPAFLIVFCPRDDCPGTKAGRPFLVAEREWMRPHRLERLSSKGKPIIIVGRSCPYCFRASRIPRGTEIG